MSTNKFTIMTKSKLRAMLIAGAAILPSFVTSATTFTYSGLSYRTLTSLTVAVRGKSNATGDIIIPAEVTYSGNTYTVTEIDEEAFKDTSIKSVSMPNTLGSIGNDAFNSCSNLTSVVVPNSVTRIGNGTFAYCSKLQSIQYGSGVKSIGKDIFTGLKSLQTVISLNPTPPTVDTWGTTTTSATLYVPGGAVGAYTSATVWKNFKTIEVYLHFSNVKELTVGNQVEEIQASTFAGCEQLSSLVLGSCLATIGDGAFSGCTALKEVIVPPSVETIGASAFAGNTALASIIMGHSVKNIGEKAFDDCPANTVSITAQTPPTAPNNTFSNYSGKLYLQGEDAVNAYYDAFTCWDRFNGYVMVEAADLKYDGENNIVGKPGDTFQLTATLMPENVTLPQVFWRSTNPEIATVDANGLVTLHADLKEVLSRAGDDDSNSTCKIIAESLYADGSMLEIMVTSEVSGVEEIIIDRTEKADNKIDYSAPYEVYNLSGMLIGRSTEGLGTGFYIVRQGRVAKKIAVK